MKDFIPFKEAVALKELDFNEPCFATYIGETFDSSVQFQSDDYFTAAPLFSQAFRFFREKYGLHQYVEYIKTANRYDWWVGHTFNNTKTYEEAELACLCKLIEIVKKPKQTVEDYYANGLKESEYEGD
jgi:hypothetical protein